ncbi:hypothetical protein E2C01_010284 [Portunus trituberculatus]|uniref:Uncharacterized protein n=1 Tax=Portunus trituberculatus TaxID=210409 RepID=A0A5B7D898_PORTR|nr:hypothetical protein [Portunus trituberculatus]
MEEDEKEMRNRSGIGEGAKASFPTLGKQPSSSQSPKGPDPWNEVCSLGNTSFLKPQDSRHKRLDLVEIRLCVGSGGGGWLEHKL